MNSLMLHDALVVAGWLVTLGGVIAVSGRASQMARRALGGAVSWLGLIVAAVALGNWHGSGWGQVAALVLFLLGGGSLAATLLPSRANRRSAGAGDTDGEMAVGRAEFYALALWLTAAALAVTVMRLAQ
jgi:hypothetical protein